MTEKKSGKAFTEHKKSRAHSENHNNVTRFKWKEWIKWQNGSRRSKIIKEEITNLWKIMPFLQKKVEKGKSVNIKKRKNGKMKKKTASHKANKKLPFSNTVCCCCCICW